MALPTLVAVGTGSANTGDATPGMPAGATTGDLLILVIEGEGEDGNADPAPTGGEWTLVGTVASATDGAILNTRCTVYRAPYNASINLTVPDAGDHTIAQVWAFRGVDATTPIDVTETGSRGSQATNSTATTTVSTTGADRLVCLAFSHGDDNQTPTGITNANLANLAGPNVFESDVGSDGTLGIWRGELASAGACGEFYWDHTGGEHNAWVMFALAPAGPSGTAFTMRPASDGSRSGFVNEVGGTTNLYASIDDDPDSPTTSDWISALGTDGYYFFGIDTLAADFDAVLSPLTVKVSVEALDFAADTEIDYMQVFASDESTAYTDEVAVADEADDGVVTAELTVNATGLAASKAAWQACRVKVRSDYTA